MPHSVFNWPSICFICLILHLFLYIYTHMYACMCKCKSLGLRETKATQELQYKAWTQPQFLEQATLGKSIKL